jgi:non-ribosomal peptide synthetase component F
MQVQSILSLKTGHAVAEVLPSGCRIEIVDIK